MDKKLFVLLVISVIAIGTFAQTVFAKPTVRALGECKDGMDNDGDGLTDLNDPGCSDKNDKSELDSNVECDDGLDNDGDGNTDYNDSGCSGPTDTDESDCGDGVCEGSETSGNCPADCGYADSCSDTDGGNVIGTFGTTSGYYNNNPFSNNDYCVDSSNIMEYYCSGDYEQSQQQSCGTDSYGSEYCAAGDEVYQDYTDYFCASGACDSNVTPQFQEDCDDSDGYGSNYCISDVVTRDYNNYYCAGGACDYNATPETVENCDLSDGYGSNYCNGDSVMRNYYNYFCSGGACNYTSTPESLVNCNIYDGYGSEYCYEGDVYMDYNDYTCSAANCTYTPTPELVEECTYGCTSGDCDPIPNSCSDSDGGFIPSVLGSASGYISENPYNHTDYCVNNVTVMEYYCSGDYAYNTTTSCITNTTSSCIYGFCI